MNIKERNKISYLHFILLILVILIHSVNNDTKIERIFSAGNGIGQFVTPLFFILSGFLFFINIDIPLDITKKLKVRVKTLIIPYLIWNLIYYIIHLILKPTNGLNINELVNALVYHTYNPSFWFMYQLIILVFLSFIVFYIVSDIKYFVLFIAVILFLVIAGINLPMINIDALTYFAFGAMYSKYYRLNKLKLISKKYFVISLIITLIFYALKYFAFIGINVFLKTPNLYTFMTILFRLAGAFLIFYFVDIVFNYDYVPKFMNDTFFLYAIHYMIVRTAFYLTKYITIKYFGYELSIAIELVVFASLPVLCVFIKTILTRLLRAKFPIQFKYLNGDR